MTCIIRQYDKSDLDAVLSSWENANKIAHYFLSKNFVDQVRHDIPNLYLPNADTWVADKDGVTVGFIALIDNEVGAIFVDPKYQGAGFGRALMDKASTLHPVLEVEVFQKNAIGRKFYSYYGFKKIKKDIHEPTGFDVFRLQFSGVPNSLENDS